MLFLKRRKRVLDLDVEDYDLEGIIGSNDIVVLDFWAPWCVPCHSINMLIDRLSTRCDSITFVKINLDMKPDIGSKFGVMSVPTIIIIVKGHIVARLSGIMEANMLDKKLREIVGGC